ncbi:glycoside-pentoside-hexuronide (GPH):cation symporter [Pseudolysinimonas sp.]|uniref:MFS transporter n=1 Tax=Pseudolysinimonas sp. TaxID=2680009 RepID=UPI00286C4A3F|nr:glycoside-pentoside-hexuronide (GPH):cation symporter [Pseudolysinimonas sp.]
MTTSTLDANAARKPEKVPSPRAQSTAIVTAAFGQNLVYATVSTFMLLYLVEYVGLSTGAIAVVTVVLTLARIIDAVADPFVGSLIDMTRTRWGKLRPFILFSAAPVALLTALIFAVPEIDETGQLVYFTICYLIWGLVYAACDVPMWGLIGSAFPDPGRRARVIGNVRAFGAIAIGVSTLGAPSLAAALSFAPETTAVGWTRAVALIAVVGMGIYLLAFFVPRERDSSNAPRLSFTELFRALFRNRPLLLVLLGSFIGFGRAIVQAGGAVFVVIAYGNDDNFTLVGAAIIVGMVIAAFTTPLVMRRISGRTLILISSFAGFAIYVGMFVGGFEDLVVLVIFIFLSGLALGVFLVAQTTMIADAVDHAENATGVRNDGISFATLTFVTKVMSAFSTLAFGIVIVIAGYQEGVVVTPAMQQIAFIGITLIPAASCLLSAIPFFFYRLGDSRRA